MAFFTDSTSFVHVYVEMNARVFLSKGESRNPKLRIPCYQFFYTRELERKRACWNWREKKTQASFFSSKKRSYASSLIDWFPIKNVKDDFYFEISNPPPPKLLVKLREDIEMYCRRTSSLAFLFFDLRGSARYKLKYQYSIDLYGHFHRRLFSRKRESQSNGN